MTRRISPRESAKRAATPSSSNSTLIQNPRGNRVLLLAQNVEEAGANQLRVQRLEAEARAARLNRGNDLGDVVADEAEPRVLTVFLDD